MNKLFVVISFMLLCFVACRTKDRQQAGRGGAATLRLQPQHHGDGGNLINMKVFIKYNSQEQPADGIYDDSVSCPSVDGAPIGTLSGLQNGNYYLLSSGYDTLFRSRVRGAIPYIISQQSVQNVFVPVSEY